jgi:hypothetical protein
MRTLARGFLIEANRRMIKPAVRRPQLRDLNFKKVVVPKTDPYQMEHLDRKPFEAQAENRLAAAPKTKNSHPKILSLGPFN